MYHLREHHVPHYSVHAASAVEGTEYNIVAEWSGARVDHATSKKKISGGTCGLFETDAAMYLDRMTLRRGLFLFVGDKPYMLFGIFDRVCMDGTENAFPLARVSLTRHGGRLRSSATEQPKPHRRP